jgi:hypothetical protein
LIAPFELARAFLAAEVEDSPASAGFADGIFKKYCSSSGSMREVVYRKGQTGSGYCMLLFWKTALVLQFEVIGRRDAETRLLPRV